MWALYQKKQWWDRRECAIETRAKWQMWGDLDRAEAVVALRKWGHSFREIAEIADCCEGTVRNFELLGEAHPRVKRYLYEGRVSTRRLVKALRRQRQEQRQRQGR